MALAVLGYLFPPAVLLALAAVFAAGIWFYASGDYRGGSWLIGKLGIALIFLIALVGRAMWPRFGAPEAYGSAAPMRLNSLHSSTACGARRETRGWTGSISRMR